MLHDENIRQAEKETFACVITVESSLNQSIMMLSDYCNVIPAVRPKFHVWLLIKGEPLHDTCVVDEDVQTLLVLLDVFGQVSDRLQWGQVQFLHHHIAIPAALPDLLRCAVGFGHVSAG